MSKISESVEKLVLPFANDLGLEIVEVEYAKKSNGNNLTIYIDKKGGVTIEDCESLHRLIDAPLDELDPTNGIGYILNVSSCGLDRPLKNLKDYLRNVGKVVEVKLYAPLDGKKVFTGAIKDANESNLILDLDGNSLEINRELIATVVPVVDL